MEISMNDNLICLFLLSMTFPCLNIFLSTSSSLKSFQFLYSKTKIKHHTQSVKRCTAVAASVTLPRCACNPSPHPSYPCNSPFFSTLVSGLTPEKTSASSVILSDPSFLQLSHLICFSVSICLNIWKRDSTDVALMRKDQSDEVCNENIKFVSSPNDRLARHMLPHSMLIDNREDTPNKTHAGWITLNYSGINCTISLSEEVQPLLFQLDAINKMYILRSSPSRVDEVLTSLSVNSN